MHASGSAGDQLAARDDLNVRREQTASPVPDDAAPASQDDILPARLDGTSYETFYGGYHTNDAYPQFLGDLEAAYPDLGQVIDHGSSFTGANPLQVACVTADASVPVPRLRSRRRCPGRPPSARLRPGSGCARQLGPLHAV